MKKVIDAPLWLEYFANTQNAADIATHLEDIENVIVPAHSMTELARTLMPQIGEEATLRLLAHIQQAQVVDIDTSIALQAAKLCNLHKINFVESLYLAIAYKENATLYTYNAKFEHLEKVHFLRRKEDMKSFRLYR